jgi:division protein CdvB (Snf7/Vps24/ESCRT-III family)
MTAAQRQARHRATAASSRKRLVEELARKERAIVRLERIIARMKAAPARRRTRARKRAA